MLLVKAIFFDNCILSFKKKNNSCCMLLAYDQKQENYPPWIIRKIKLVRECVIQISLKCHMHSDVALLLLLSFILLTISNIH